MHAVWHLTCGSFPFIASQNRTFRTPHIADVQIRSANGKVGSKLPLSYMRLIC